MGRKSLMMIGKTLWGPQETTYSFGIYLGLLWDLTGSFWDRAECLERNVLGLPWGQGLQNRTFAAFQFKALLQYFDSNPVPVLCRLDVLLQVDEDLVEHRWRDHNWASEGLRALLEEVARDGRLSSM